MHATIIGFIAMTAAAVAEAPTPSPAPAPAPAPAATSAPAPTPTPLPDNEIFLVAVTRPDGGLRFGPAENVTRRAGYDNQPAFLPDGSGFLYTADGESGPTDIHFMKLPEGVAARVVATPEAEYSPTPVPDGSGYSTVVVEKDGTQRLWKYKLDGSGGYALLPEVRGVGYHAWLSPTQVALFIVGNDEQKIPHTLHVVDVTSGKATELAKNVGRSLHRVPGTSRVSYVDKSDPARWRIVSRDADGGNLLEHAPTLEGAEDYCWLPDGTILMGKGGKLFRWAGEPGKPFVEIADFGDLGGSINRIAVSHDGSRLALVVTVDVPQTRGIRG
jgi:hypothetical protein